MLGNKRNPLRQHILGVKKDHSYHLLGNKVEDKTRTSTHRFKNTLPALSNETDEQKQREAKGLASKQTRTQDFYN